MDQQRQNTFGFFLIDLPRPTPCLTVIPQQNYDKRTVLGKTKIKIQNNNKGTITSFSRAKFWYYNYYLKLIFAINMLGSNFPMVLIGSLQRANFKLRKKLQVLEVALTACKLEPVSSFWLIQPPKGNLQILLTTKFEFV